MKQSNNHRTMIYSQLIQQPTTPTTACTF